MARPLHIDPSSATPIWSQIEEQLRRLVTAGSLAPRSAVPSVRDLARELTVNPATVSKAYQRLVAQGLLEVRRGDGTYVAESPPGLEAGERNELLTRAAERMVIEALQAGARKSEVETAVQAAWNRLGREHGADGGDALPEKARTR
ncbi:MAG TPA: GntR family transcriptional regulator [Thermoanaerobaculia bacterium]|nr:GntR family transcriptional regulator [Thermoanaerobaculia bacterium]